MGVTSHSVEFEANSANNILRLVVEGKLTHEDYQVFVPELEKWIAMYGKVRILFEMVDFHGWTVSAGWEDLKLGFRHFSDIEKIAMVGDRSWEKGMSLFCKPFTKAEVRYFDASQRDGAIAWIAA